MDLPFLQFPATGPLTFKQWHCYSGSISYSPYHRIFYNFYNRVTQKRRGSITTLPISFNLHLEEPFDDWFYDLIDEQQYFPKIDEWLYDIVGAHFGDFYEGHFSGSTLWCDFFLKCFHELSLKEYRASEHIRVVETYRELYAYVSHIKRIKDILMVEIRRRLSLQSLALFSLPRIEERELFPHLLSVKTEYQMSLSRRMRNHHCVMCFWEAILGPLTSEVYGPGF